MTIMNCVLCMGTASVGFCERHHRELREERHALEAERARLREAVTLAILILTRQAPINYFGDEMLTLRKALEPAP